MKKQPQIGMRVPTSAPATYAVVSEGLWFQWSLLWVSLFVVQRGLSVCFEVDELRSQLGDNAFESPVVGSKICVFLPEFEMI